MSTEPSTTYVIIMGVFFIVTASILSQAGAQVILTEIDYHNSQIEIVNLGNSTVDISSWQLCSRSSYRAISALTVVEGSTNLEAGGLIVVSGFNLNDASADLGLYNARSFGSPGAMQSFVQWGGGGIGRESVAVAKGIWSVGEFVPSVGDGHSIEFDGVGSSAAAWFDQPNPNFGSFGDEAVVLSVVINEVDYRVNDRVELKNISADSIDIGNWWICSLQDYIQISNMDVVQGDTNLAPDTTVVLSGFPFDDSAADLGLYSGSGFTTPAQMESFVQWGSSVGRRGREPIALEKGIWAAGDFVSLVDEGHSIEYSGDGFTSTDWFDQPSPTLGPIPIFGVALEIIGDSSRSISDAIGGATYVLTVTNTGNQDDTVNLSVDPEVGIEGSVLGSLHQGSIALAADGTGEVTLTVAGDAFTTDGAYDVKVAGISAGDNSKIAEVTTTTTIELVPPPPAPWDVNNDGTVNILDLVSVAGQFGQSGDDLDGDVNGDGTVNILDLVTVAGHFGETVPATPEIR